MTQEIGNGIVVGPVIIALGYLIAAVCLLFRVLRRRR